MYTWGKEHMADRIGSESDGKDPQQR